MQSERQKHSYTQRGREGMSEHYCPLAGFSHKWLTVEVKPGQGLGEGF